MGPIQTSIRLRTARLYYPPSSVELDGVGTCELTANEGHHFCPLGAMDCIDSPYGPKCRSELQASLVEASSKLGFNGVPNPERLGPFPYTEVTIVVAV
ncbi:hypothetical protein TSMEX_006061 [Taenia solium]|eukprot:TsM_000935400 transcript=TsM_000935400 gene=TsM_000935400